MHRTEARRVRQQADYPSDRREDGEDDGGPAMGLVRMMDADVQTVRSTIDLMRVRAARASATSAMAVVVGCNGGAGQ